MRRVFTIARIIAVLMAMVALVYWVQTDQQVVLMSIYYFLVGATVFELLERIATYFPTRWAYLSGVIVALLFALLFIILIQSAFG